MPAVSGFKGRVLLGGVSGRKATVTRWSVAWRAEDPEVTNFETNTMYTGTVAYMGGSYVTGVTDADVTMDVLWDTSWDAFGTSIAGQLLPGETVSAQLYYDKNNSSSSFNLDLFIEDIEIDDEVRGIVRYSVKSRGNGKFNSGTPNFTPPT